MIKRRSVESAVGIRCFALGLGLFFGISLAAAAQTGGAVGRPSVDELTDQFEDVIFNSEFKSLKASTKITKWKQPLRIEIKSFGETLIKNSDGTEERRLKQVRVKHRHFEFIQQHLNTLVKLTGVATEDIKKTGMPPNFSIFFVPALQMANPYLADDVDRTLLRKLTGEGGCYFLAWSDKKSGAILKARIVVNVERLMKRINHCLLEEIVQSMGLPNDIITRWPSIFSDSGVVTELSRSDTILIRTLYHPKIKVGLPRAEAMTRARAIIGKLDATLP